MPQIELHKVRKSFGRQRVLRGIDLSVNAGEILTVLGRSGTGKSVLLKLMIGLEKPDSGSIRINGAEITTLSRKDLDQLRQKIGFLFQQAALYDSMTIEENVDFPLKRHTRLGAPERRKRVNELLRSVGIESSDGGKLPAEISGGMRKRVGLARALVLDPAIIMFDEPTAGLDPVTSEEIDSLILDMRKKRHITSVVVTHDIHSARHISDRLVMLDQGQIIAEGSFHDLEHSGNPMVHHFLSEPGTDERQGESYGT